MSDHHHHQLRARGHGKITGRERIIAVSFDNVVVAAGVSECTAFEGASSKRTQAVVRLCHDVCCGIPFI